MLLIFSSNHLKKKQGEGHIASGLPQISVLIRLIFFKGNVNYISSIVYQKLEHILLKIF